MRDAQSNIIDYEIIDPRLPSQLGADHPCTGQNTPTLREFSTRKGKFQIQDAAVWWG